MATYVGLRLANASPLVWVIEQPACRLLDLHTEVLTYSESGFDWGHRSAGSSQLAIAILRSVTGDEGSTVELFNTFCNDVVRKLPHHGFVLHSEHVEEWIILQIASREHSRTLLQPAEWGVDDGEAK